MSPVDDLSSLDATAQADLVRRGDASPSELVESAIARAEAVNPQINAIIHERYDKARDEAASGLPAGPFRGVPFAVKDLGCPTAGDPYHCGTRFLRDAGYVAPEDSHLARRLRAAGLVSLGKTNTPEVGASATTEPLAFGPTRNPWDLSRTPMGSSGGSCAAVASDGGGSIRIPSSACGLLGLKVSRGRVSTAPGSDLMGFSVHLAVTRSVRDMATVLDCVAGPVAGDHVQIPAPDRPFAAGLGTALSALRIGVMTDAPGSAFVVDPACVTAAEDTAHALESLGHAVEVAHPAILDEPSTAGIAYSAIYAARSTGWPGWRASSPGRRAWSRPPWR
jgi:amidase